MKQFIKNNIKTFITVLITTIIVGSISVYAASQYFAKDITFTPTNENFKKENGEPVNNVEDALNELYKTQNDDFVNFSVVYRLSSSFNNQNGGALDLVSFSKYKYVSIISKICSIDSSNNYMYDSSWNKSSKLSMNTDYEISDYRYLGLESNVSSNGWCNVTYSFHN